MKLRRIANLQIFLPPRGSLLADEHVASTNYTRHVERRFQTLSFVEIQQADPS